MRERQSFGGQEEEPGHGDPALTGRGLLTVQAALGPSPDRLGAADTAEWSLRLWPSRRRTIFVPRPRHHPNTLCLIRAGIFSFSCRLVTRFQGLHHP